MCKMYTLKVRLTPEQLEFCAAEARHAQETGYNNRQPCKVYDFTTRLLMKRLRELRKGIIGKVD